MKRASYHHSRAARIGAYARRIVRHFDRSLGMARGGGALWYAAARAEAESIAEETGLPLDRVIAVLASLSPRVSWAQCVRAARTLCYALANGEPEPVVAGTRGNRRKAWAILNGADIEATLGPTAPKVRAFYANISGDWSRVTVDVWATRAATGRDIIPRPTTYGIFERAYQNAARARNIEPAVLQATVWLTLRWEASGGPLS